MVLHIIKHKMTPVEVNEALIENAKLTKQWVYQIRKVAYAPAEIRDKYLAGYVSVKKALAETVQRKQKTDAQRNADRKNSFLASATRLGVPFAKVEDSFFCLVLPDVTDEKLTTGVDEIKVGAFVLSIRKVKK